MLLKVIIWLIPLNQSNVGVMPPCLPVLLQFDVETIKEDTSELFTKQIDADAKVSVRLRKDLP